MRRTVVNEADVEALDLPGRRLRWLITGTSVGAEHCSMCLITVQPGQTVKPAHSHPNGEEVIYVVSGTGRVLIDGVIQAVSAGSACLFPQGSIHMLQNSGPDVMKVACFFAPPSSLETYKFFEGVDFPDAPRSDS